MKRNYLSIAALLMGAMFWLACNNAETGSNETSSISSDASPALTGQSGVVDEDSQKDVVKIAVGSPDHTTLVKALQTAEYVDALSNAGPFTVFAPVNAAFDKLPAGTVENLLKPAQKDALRDILEYHVYIGVLRPEMLKDGLSFGQANGDNISISVKDGKPMVNNATILASIPASNGIIHVVDEVLLPPSK